MIDKQILDGDSSYSEAINYIISSNYLKKSDKITLIKAENEDNEKFSLEISTKEV